MRSPAILLGTNGQDKSKGGNSQDSSLTSDMPEVNSHCSLWLFDHTLLQFGQVNHSLTRFHFSSLSVPVGPGCPTNSTAELRRGTECHILMLIEVGPLQIHQGLSQMQRLKSPNSESCRDNASNKQGRENFVSVSDQYLN